MFLNSRAVNFSLLRPILSGCYVFPTVWFVPFSFTTGLRAIMPTRMCICCNSIMSESKLAHVNHLPERALRRHASQQKKSKPLWHDMNKIEVYNDLMC